MNPWPQSGAVARALALRVKLTRAMPYSLAEAVAFHLQPGQVVEWTTQVLCLCSQSAYKAQVISLSTLNKLRDY